MLNYERLSRKPSVFRSFTSLEVSEFDRLYAEVEVPFKRRSPGRGKRGIKAKELTIEQKVFNRKLSKERIVVEHTISHLKSSASWRISSETASKNYDTMTNIVCGLTNFRMMGTTAI